MQKLRARGGFGMPGTNLDAVAPGRSWALEARRLYGGIDARGAVLVAEAAKATPGNPLT